MNRDDAQALRIFILGPFLSLDNSKKDFKKLTKLKKHLARLGAERFVSKVKSQVKSLKPFP